MSRFDRRVGSMVQGAPFPHSRFPWVAVYPWRCSTCMHVTVTRASFGADPGLCAERLGDPLEETARLEVYALTEAGRRALSEAP